MTYWFRQITVASMCDSLFDCFWCCMNCSCHHCALTTYWYLTCPEKFWAINQVTENIQITSVNKSQSPKAAHCVYRESEAFVMCVCGPLFVTCCYWCVATTDNLSATQPEELWSETKRTVQTHQQAILNPISVMQYCVLNLHLTSSLLDADRHIVWYHLAAKQLCTSFWVLYKRKNKICLSWTPSAICLIRCPVRMAIKVSD